MVVIEGLTVLFIIFDAISIILKKIKILESNIKRSSLIFQTAEHLANTYGDRAIKVARLANLTGKRWPVVGNKLHPDYPYIEAEVSNSGRSF